MKTYKWFRGLLKASAFATVMFVMQACYGAPHQMDEPYWNEDEEYYQGNDTIQSDLGTEIQGELEAE
ncbi:MAG: hypothetical protein J6P73_06160 [Bacteroidales bacterium]|nr:hypothetical protein [Bacteroidales bacterium]